MAYNPIYEPSQPESFFSGTVPSQQYPSSHPMDPRHNYASVEGTAMGLSFDIYDDRPGYQGTGTTNTEDAVDPASRPRLTQEQLAELETQFALHHKPNTDYKKNLAENMGVDYSKVNNWFQNRRAKAKHENQAQLRSDPSFDDSRNFLPDDFPSMEYTRASAPQPPVYYSSPEQGPIPSEGLVSYLDFSGVTDAQINYNPNSTPLITSLASAPRYDNENAFHPSFSNAVPSNSLPTWPVNNRCVGEKMPTPSILEVGSFGTSPRSPPVQSYGLDLTQGGAVHHGHQIYQTTHDGQFVGNPSSQSFVTSPSNGEDHTRLITPPQETSPLPGLNQATFQNNRRTSNDSELAENFDTIHLQQTQAGLSMYGSSNNASASDLVSTTGLLTPVITPDTTDDKLPFATGRDLATRRNRRPPKLQPDVGRSVSYTGPGTSPHLRISPPGSGTMSPVRRIKSTGNNQNVMTGRIKKQGTSSAQLSPRNYDACFQAAATSDVQSSADLHSHNHQLSGPVVNSLTSSSPIPFAQQNQASWVDSASQFPVTPSSWDHGTTGPTAFTHGPETGMGWTGNEHTNLFATEALPQVSHPQQYGYHCPPQSAPSHVTTFDGASSMMPTSRTWQPPQMVPEPYRDDTHLPMPVRPFYQHHHSHSGPTSQFPPQLNHFQTYHPEMAYFQPFQQYPNRTPTPVLKPLDIKVETGPSPPKELAQTSQERKEYTFQNSFSHDPDFATNTKK